MQYLTDGFVLLGFGLTLAAICYIGDKIQAYRAARQPAVRGATKI